MKATTCWTLPISIILFLFKLWNLKRSAYRDIRNTWKQLHAERFRFHNLNRKRIIEIGVEWLAEAITCGKSQGLSALASKFDDVFSCDDFTARLSRPGGASLKTPRAQRDFVFYFSLRRRKVKTGSSSTRHLRWLFMFSGVSAENIKE